MCAEAVGGEEQRCPVPRGPGAGRGGVRSGARLSVATGPLIEAEGEQRVPLRDPPEHAEAGRYRADLYRVEVDACRDVGRAGARDDVLDDALRAVAVDVAPPLGRVVDQQ